MLGFGDAYSNSSEFSVNENSAMRVATVSTCLKVLGETVAAIPRSVKKRVGNTRVTDYANPLNYLIGSSPNKSMTSYNWTFAMVVGAAGWSVSYAPIIKNKYGVVESIGLLPPWEAEYVSMPDGSIYIKDRRNGKVYNQDDMIILKPFTVDGINPMSIIRYNAETIGFALQSQNYRGKVFKVKPPGYLGSDQPIRAEQIPDIAKYWSGQTSNGVPILYNGLKFNPISFSPADLQLLEATKATKTDIYGLFRMPPTLAQDYERATFANAEQQDLVFTKHTILPIITAMEQEIDMKALPNENRYSETPSYTNFNMKGLLQGDFKTRMEGYRTLWQTGAISANDINALEDLNPVEGGDKYYVPMNMIATDKVDDFYDKLTALDNKKQIASEENTRLLSDIDKLIRMNGYNHHEHA